MLHRLTPATINTVYTIGLYELKRLNRTYPKYANPYAVEIDSKAAEWVIADITKGSFDWGPLPYGDGGVDVVTTKGTTISVKHTSTKPDWRGYQYLRLDPHKHNSHHSSIQVLVTGTIITKRNKPRKRAVTLRVEGWLTTPDAYSDKWWCYDDLWKTYLYKIPHTKLQPFEDFPLWETLQLLVGEDNDQST